jgi:iron complex outermembrane receptor protein
MCSPSTAFGRVGGCRLPTLLAGLVLSLAALAASAQAATVRGTVSNQATSKNLVGVTVSVSETGRSALTETGGLYEISGLAPGDYTLVFDYPGLDRKEVKVTVTDAAPAQQDVALRSDIYQLDTFTVASVREGNAASIVQQKKAVNVTNVVTSDAFGNIAKGNVGNFLKRIPGIAGTTDEVDTENILVRGIAANFTSLDIDGTRTANGSPDGRNQSAAGIPTDLIERVEVIKAAKPETDADSLGGRVNLVTKSAYDRQGRSLTFRAATSYSMTYGSDVGRRDGDPFAPSLAGTYSDVFSVLGGKNNLGLIAQANHERILEVRGTTAWNFGSAASNSGTIPAGELDYPQFNNVSVALHEVVRSSASLRGDLKISDRLTVGGTVGWSTHENNMWRTRNQMAAGVVNVPLSTDPMFTVIDGARYRAIRETRDQTTDKTTARFNAKWRGANDLKADFDVSYEKADRTEYRESINPTSRLRLNYALDRHTDARWPVLRVMAGPYSGNTVASTSIPSTFLNINPFADDFRDTNDAPVFFRNHNTENEIFGTRVDLTKKLKTRLPIELKTGLRFRSDITKADRDELNGALNIATSTFLRDLRGFLDDDWDLGGAIGRYPVGFVPDEQKLSLVAARYVGAADPLTAWTFDPGIFTINNGNTRGNSLLNDRKIWEEISAAYVQGEVELSKKLKVLGGLRVERTDIERSIPLRNRRTGVAGTLAEFTGRTRDSKSYDNWFPSVHARYELTPNLIVHAAYSTTIGRPNFGDLLAAADANPDTRTISVPNLELLPQESKNFDLSLEYYFEPVGVFSVGVFRKDITNYAVTLGFDISAAEAEAEYGAPISPGDIGTWRVSTKVNDGDAMVQGVEFNYSQQFQFLPGAFKGLGVFANLTLLETEGTYTRGTGGAVTTDLENFIPTTANAGLNYAYGRYDLRLQWNYTDAFPEDVDIANPLIRNKWRGDRWAIDFTGRYKVTKNFTIFCDLSNLTENHGKKFRGTTDPVRREETNALGFLLTAGVLASF